MKTKHSVKNCMKFVYDNFSDHAFLILRCSIEQLICNRLFGQSQTK